MLPSRFVCECVRCGFEVFPTIFTYNLAYYRAENVLTVLIVLCGTISLIGKYLIRVETRKLISVHFLVSMSDQEGIDQNGGVPDEQCVAPVTPEPVLNDTTQSDLDNFNNTTELYDVTASSLGDSHLVSASEADETIEYHQDVTGTTQEENSNQSRELKSLLALSKEANLDTNLVRKRKVLPSRKRSKGELRLKSSKVQYPVTAESELEMELHSSDSRRSEVGDDDGTASTSSGKSAKRKKSVDEVSLDEGTKKGRKSFTSGVVMFKVSCFLLFTWLGQSNRLIHFPAK